MSYIPSPPKDSPEFTGAPKVPTPQPGDASKQIANTEFVINTITSQPDPVALSIVFGS